MYRTGRPRGAKYYSSGENECSQEKNRGTGELFLL